MTQTLICEDSALFNLPLSYSVVAVNEVIAYKISVKEVYQRFPSECIYELKINILPKYKWFYERLVKVEEFLVSHKEN